MSERSAGPTCLLTLDAMRGLAALAVLLMHATDAALAPSGYLAVDFFFLLSGFVIART
jgi:peptidoglycan/LPS O-acetylase OafA/YrhL